MTANSDNYWDDLGVAWRAIEIDVDVVRPRLRTRLRRQSLVIHASLALGVPLATAGVGLGAFTVWWGWMTATWNFITRGIAIAVIAAIALKTLWALVSIRVSADASTLVDMVGLAIRRARTTLLAVRLGLYACAIAAVLGVVGTVIRTSAGKPPALSPVLDVAGLVLVAVSLLVYRRRTAVTLAKMSYLQQVITSG